MQDQNKDSLETFFRKGAQNYNIEFNEGDWQKLKALLDEEMPVAFSFRSLLRKFWPIPVMLLLIPAFWYTLYYWNPPEAHSGDPALSGTYSAIEPGNKASSTLIEQSMTGVPSPAEQSEDGALSQSSEEVYTGSSDTGQPQQTNSPGSETVQPEFIMPDEQSDYSSGGVMRVDRGGLVSESTNAVNTQEDIVNERRLTLNEGESGLNDRGNAVTDRERAVTGWANAVADKSVTTAERPGTISSLEPFPPEYEYGQASSTTNPELKSIIPGPGRPSDKLSFYVGMGFSPDFSTVGLGNFVSPGFRWKLLTELRISRRWQISTGLVWVRNKYSAYGEDYHAPARYWKNGIVADETYGECVMIDLPLNLRFNILDKNRHQFFISGGASTYFLLKEDYYFHYEQDDPDLPDYWGTDQTSIYPFKIVNISVGYQYFFGRKGSIQVEPFLKLPTAGVGWGNVDLHTLGIYFMYKYQIGK